MPPRPSFAALRDRWPHLPDSSLPPSALLLARAILRVEQRPHPRLVLERGARVFVSALHQYLLGGADGSVYLGGSFGTKTPIYGLSDVDLLFAVHDDAAAERVRQRWRNLRTRFPALASLVDVWVYRRGDLVDSLSDTDFTFGLVHPCQLTRRGPGTFLTRDPAGFRQRPGLYSPAHGWHRVRGAQLQPGSVTPGYRAIASWLELQWWWRKAVMESVAPHPHSLAYLCLKLLTEPARIWLWLTRDQQVWDPDQLLATLRRELPDEEEAADRAFRLSRALHRSPAPPLAPAVAFLLRMSMRVASHLDQQAASAGACAVRLVRDDEEVLPPIDARPTSSRDSRAPLSEALPLVDWSARTGLACAHEETFVPSAGRADDPVSLAAAACEGVAGSYPCLRHDPLLVLPSCGPLARLIHRTIQCSAVEPVTFAVLLGQPYARFPQLEGWSARECARRAVDEHRLWLTTSASSSTGDSLGRMFAAARAGLFLESVEAEDPCLPLTASSIAYLLGERSSRDVQPAQAAWRAYREWRLGGPAPAGSVVWRLAEVVERLPAFALEREPTEPMLRP